MDKSNFLLCLKCKILMHINSNHENCPLEDQKIDNNEFGIGNTLVPLTLDCNGTISLMAQYFNDPNDISDKPPKLEPEPEPENLKENGMNGDNSNGYTNSQLATFIKSDDGYTCDICLKQFTTSSNFRYHTLIHTGELPYICNFCNLRFRSTSNLNAHVKRYHPKKRGKFGEETEESDNDNQLMEKLEEPVPQNTCTLCKSTFGCNVDLIAHTKIHSFLRRCIFITDQMSETGFKILSLD